MPQIFASALLIQLQSNIEQQPVIKMAKIQSGQFRNPVQPVFQRITMNEQRTRGGARLDVMGKPGDQRTAQQAVVIHALELRQWPGELIGLPATPQAVEQHG